MTNQHSGLKKYVNKCIEDVDRICVFVYLRVGVSKENTLEMQDKGREAGGE